MSKKLPSFNPSFFKIYSKSCMQLFVTDEVTAQEVCNSKSKCQSALGVDNILLKFTKLPKCAVSPHLAFLFIKCIKQKIFHIILNWLMLFQFPQNHCQNLSTNFAQFRCFLFSQKHLKKSKSYSITFSGRKQQIHII